MIYLELFGIHKKDKHASQEQTVKKEKRKSKLYENDDIKRARDFLESFFDKNNDEIIKLLQSSIKSTKHSKHYRCEKEESPYVEYCEGNYGIYHKGAFISSYGYSIDLWDFDPNLRSNIDSPKIKGIIDIIEKDNETMSKKISSWFRSKGLTGVVMYSGNGDWDGIRADICINAEDAIKISKSDGIFESVELI